jgi:glutamyl-tRNA reductase
MILGEPQVTGQIKTSYGAAYSDNSTGPVLNRLFHRAFGATKNVRTKTGIGKRAVSVSYAAKELARQIFGELDEVSVMLIGAGETGRLASRHLKRAGARQFIVANRTLERGRELAVELGGVAVELQSSHSFLSQADVVIGAGRSRVGEALVSVEQARDALKLRNGRPQFYIDLGVPRNFDANIDGLSDCYLYGVDDLEEVVRQNLDSRSLELESAEHIIEHEVSRFFHWMEVRKVEPAIKQLKSHFNDVAEIEVAKTIKRLRRAGYAVAPECELENAIRAMANSMSARILHGPISRIKSDTEVEKNEAEKVLELFSDFE